MEGNTCSPFSTSGTGSRTSQIRFAEFVSPDPFRQIHFARSISPDPFSQETAVLAELVDIKTYRLAGHRRRAGARCRHRPRRVTGPLAAAAGSYLRPVPAARAAAA